MTSPYDAWLGRERSYTDQMDPGTATRMWRTLSSDHTANLGDHLPEGGHWLYFLPQAQQSNLGPDGHEQRGEFLPPVPAPRRMFAGGKAQYPRPLILGKSATLT